MSTYINLRTFSDYSIGKSVIKLNKLVEYCEQNLIPAIGLTDYNNLFGSLEFAIECTNRGVQPIIGCVIKTVVEDFFSDILLIAKNKYGYENLIKLVSSCYLKNHKIPHINLESIFDHSHGLILLLGSNNSPVETLFKSGKEKIARKIIETCKGYFRCDLYLELSRINNKIDDEFENFIKDVAIELDTPIVATNPTQYLDQDMQDALDTMICITEGRYLVEKDRNTALFGLHLKCTSEMNKLFCDIPEAILNTEVIAKKCHFLLRENKPLLPRFFSSKEREHQELVIQSKNGLIELLQRHNLDGDKKNTYFDRLEYELNIINSMEFSGYFLIVADFIQWSKKHNIPVGAGRGSGAGSIVAWSLKITDIDPIKFGLIFERFLNPHRISMPDFDIDFCQERRDEVVEYVKNRFGEEKVAHIITFGKLQARAVLRDVGRVLQIPYSQVSKICKMVPNNPANPITLKEAIDMDRELNVQSKNDPNLKKLISLSLKLEGINRHISTHAAGVVIADRDLLRIVPLYKDLGSNTAMIQYSLKYAEKVGLVKFDFLGLKTLTVISWTCQLINKNKRIFDIEQLPLDDAKTYKMLSNGDCIGVFQFESSGMRETIKKIVPDNINDLIALASLYRPGPMDNIPSYINRKHKKEKIEYIHPALSNVLEETYGIIVYQEQVMQIAQIIANYTLGEADLLRRAMGKKIKEEMESQRNKFIQGCISNKINKQKAEEIFNLINKFASYGFNKSHAAAYAYISYQTAYLKAHYTNEFIVSSINLEIDNTDKVYLFILEAKKFGIEVLPPDINYSESDFIIENQKIRFGLSGIKGIGKKVAELFLIERQKNGIYNNIFDFVKRVFRFGLSKKILENLIKSGAFESFQYNRKTLFMNIEFLLKHGFYNDSNRNQLYLFSDSMSHSQPILKQYKDWEEKEKLDLEFECFGFYMSAHPIKKYENIIDKLNITPSSEISNTCNNKSKIKLVGVLINKKIRSTPRGKYAFLQISDTNGLIDLAIFDESLLYKADEILVEGNMLHFSVEVKKDTSGVIRIIAESIETLIDIIYSSNIRAVVTIKNHKDLEYVSKTLTYDIGIKTSLSVQNENGDTTFFCSEKPFFIDVDNMSNLIELGIAKLN